VFTFESLEWAMGFQWPVIAVFAALLAVGIGRLMTWGGEEQALPGAASLTGAQKKKTVQQKSAANVVRPAGRLIKGINTRPLPPRTMRKHVRRQGSAAVARSKQR
jgi:hypothetical protein